MDVCERMTAYPITIILGETVQAASRLMRAHHIRHLPVVDAAGTLLGIVTDRDIRQILFAPPLRTQAADPATLPEQITVDEIMSVPAVTTTPFADLAEAAKVMHDHKIGALPVVDCGRVVGILSEVDVLRAFYELAGRRLRARPEDW